MPAGRPHTPCYAPCPARGRTSARGGGADSPWLAPGGCGPPTGCNGGRAGPLVVWVAIVVADPERSASLARSEGTGASAARAVATAPAESGQPCLPLARARDAAGGELPCRTVGVVVTRSGAIKELRHDTHVPSCNRSHGAIEPASWRQPLASRWMLDVVGGDAHVPLQLLLPQVAGVRRRDRLGGKGMLGVGSASCDPKLAKYAVT